MAMEPGARWPAAGAASAHSQILPIVHSVCSSMAPSVLAPHKNGLADGSGKLRATAKVFQAIQGHWLSACLGVLMELRIPEILADGGEMTFSEAYPKTTCVPHCHAAPPAPPVCIAVFVGRKAQGLPTPWPERRLLARRAPR